MPQSIAKQTRYQPKTAGNKQTKSPTKYISKYAQEKARDTSSCNEIFLSTDTSDPKSDLSFAYPVSYEGFSMY